MAITKLKADLLFDGYCFRDMPSVLVIGDDGKVNDIIKAEEAGGDIREFKGILSPGFINCHCHLELSHMKGKISEGTGLPEFVYRVVNERAHPEEEILKAIEKAEDEMLRNGIVAVGDIINNSLAIPQKIKQRIFYHNFIEASGYNPSIVEARFQRSLEIFSQYAAFYETPADFNSIVPHAPYSVADEL